MLTYADTSSDPHIKVLHALERFDANLERYLHVTVHAVMAIVEQEGASMEVRIAAVQWIARTSRRLNVLEFASRIIHPLARLLEGGHVALHRPAVVALCSLMQARMLTYAVGCCLRRCSLSVLTYASVC